MFRETWVRTSTWNYKSEEDKTRFMWEGHVPPSPVEIMNWSAEKKVNQLHDIDSECNIVIETFEQCNTNNTVEWNQQT